MEVMHYRPWNWVDMRGWHHALATLPLREEPRDKEGRTPKVSPNLMVKTKIPAVLPHPVTLLTELSRPMAFIRWFIYKG
jgi:hypothetical protein